MLRRSDCRRMANMGEGCPTERQNANLSLRSHAAAMMNAAALISAPASNATINHAESNAQPHTGAGRRIDHADFSSARLPQILPS